MTHGLLRCHPGPSAKAREFHNAGVLWSRLSAFARLRRDDSRGACDAYATALVRREDACQKLLRLVVGARRVGEVDQRFGGLAVLLHEGGKFFRTCRRRHHGLLVEEGDEAWLLEQLCELGADALDDAFGRSLRCPQSP